MRTNSFTNLTRKKSNDELEHILEDKKNYTDEAIQAVIWELENRNIIEKGSIVHEVVVEEKEELPENTPRNIESSQEKSFENLVLPILYSKKAIQGFTILFSTIFGAILLMSNLKKMNQPKARMQVLFFGISYSILSVIVLSFLPNNFFITLLFNLIGYLVLTEYYWNNSLGKDLEIEKKSIQKPLIISLVVLVVVLFLQFLPQILEVQN